MIDKLAQKYRDESARIREARLVAWCSTSDSLSICGVECGPLTARAWVDLSLESNLILEGGEPTRGDVCAYIYRSSKHYIIGNARKVKKAHKRIIKAYMRTHSIIALAECYQHLADAFQEIPRTQSMSNSINNRFPDIEGIVASVDEVAARYGTSPDEVMDWPLNRIFQLQKAARLATIPEYKLRQPESLLEIRREFLNVKNNGGI